MSKKAIPCLFAFTLFLFSPPLLFSKSEEFRKLDSQETSTHTVTGNGHGPPGKTSMESASGPDLLIRDLGLNEDMELYTVVSNAGEVDLVKGSTLRIRIFVNNRKISDFEHLMAKVLKAKTGNRYTIRPPYPVAIGGVSLVKASIRPTLSSHDIDLENNTLVRNFIVYPFRIEPGVKQEFSFPLSTPHAKGSELREKVRAEARWDGDGFPLRLSFRGPGLIKGDASISGRSPLKMEVPVSFEETERMEACRISVTNLLRKKVVGNVIIQHP